MAVLGDSVRKHPPPRGLRGRRVCVRVDGTIHACKAAKHSWTAEVRRKGKLMAGHKFTAYRMRLPERTRLAHRAVLPLTAATRTAKNPGTELSITGSPIMVPIWWDRRRHMAGFHCATHPPLWSLLWVTSWLHCMYTGSLPRVQGEGGWTSGTGNPALPAGFPSVTHTHAAQWCPFQCVPMQFFWQCRLKSSSKQAVTHAI